MTNFTRALLGTVLVLISTLCLGFIVSKTMAGVGVWDVTANKRYTLTDGSKNILDKLQRPLTLKLFYSKNAVNKSGADALAMLTSHYFYVSDLLNNMARYSNGKLTVEEYDPEPFSDAADEAAAFALQKDPMGYNIFFGIALTSDTGAREVIKFLHPALAGGLEYEIMELIDRATHRKKSKIGVMSSLPLVGETLTDQMRQMRQMMRQPVKESWIFIKELQQNRYEIESVDANVTEIPEGLDFLLVIHPKGFTDEALFAIDQYVMGGGKAVFFVDPFCQLDQPPPNPRNQFASMSHNRTSEVNKLLEAWGVTMPTDKYAGDRVLAAPIRGPTGGVMNFIGYVHLKDKMGCYNEEEVISQGLDQMIMVYPGALKSVNRGTEVASLVHTTATGNTWYASSYELANPMSFNPEKINDKLEDGDKPIMMVARITGTLKSAFPNGLPGKDPVPTPDSRPAPGEVPDPDKEDAASAKQDDPEGKPASKPTEKKDGEKKGDEKKAAEKGKGSGNGGGMPQDPKAGQDPKSDQDPKGSQDPKGAQDPKGDEPPKPEHLKQTKEPNTVIVVADVDLLGDGIAYANTFFGPVRNNSNSALLQGIIEYLGGSQDLIDVRARGRVNRELDHITAIRKKAQEKTAAQVKTIEAEIQNYQSELSSLQGKVNEKNVGALQSEALDKKKKTEQKIREKQRDLRRLRSDERQAIEGTKSTARLLNTFLLPGLVLVIGALLGVSRYRKRKVQVLGGVS